MKLEQKLTVILGLIEFNRALIMNKKYRYSTTSIAQKVY